MPYGFIVRREILDMEINVHAESKEYSIYLERGLLSRAKELIGREGHVFMVSDDGVPEVWRGMLTKQYPDSVMYIFKNGEASKNFNTLQDILKAMQNAHISRKDTVIALGGGVVGDMAGFAAAIYMRGIHYINIPTTTLSQIDSSIGGKTAIDFNGIKNSVGSFLQPDMVLVDPDTLTTLPGRHFHNGLAEAVKEGLIRSEALFEIFERDDPEAHIDEIIERCLRIKKEIVEKDEKEQGERKLLNFGHTFGHAYESYYGMNGYYHGECVGMGMITVLDNEDIKERLKTILIRLDLPVSCNPDKKKIMNLIQSDKKADHDHITVVQVDRIGHGYLEEWDMKKIGEKLGI
jgi:3-dehydroquinate synthase